MLTQIALGKIIENRPLRLKLGLALGVGEQAIMKYVKLNSDNLTKAAALKVIRDETGLSDDQILEPELVGRTN